MKDYMTLDGLFKIVPFGRDDYETVLCIPTLRGHILMDMYHSSLIGGHTGITKCYQTICRRFYCPNLTEQLRAYITGCHTCQNVQERQKLSEAIPEVHKFKHTSYEAHQ